jgi:hypothetical protein
MVKKEGSGHQGKHHIRILHPDIRVASGYFSEGMSKEYNGLWKISGYPEYPGCFYTAKTRFRNYLILLNKDKKGRPGDPPSGYDIRISEWHPDIFYTLCSLNSVGYKKYPDIRNIRTIFALHIMILRYEVWRGIEVSARVGTLGPSYSPGFWGTCTPKPRGV